MDAKRLRKWLVQGLAPVAAAAALLAAFLVLDRLARDRLRAHDRYALAFVDVDCESPPGLTRKDFLEEVQYLGGLPDRLSLLDNGLAGRLADAFARHPWVAKVEGVTITSTRKVLAGLVFRKPALAVLDRAVDGDGVLLPQTAPVAGLPVLRGHVATPAGPAGSPWGDVRVEGAARTAAFLQPHRERLSFPEFRWAEEELILSGPRHLRVRWGRPPGAENKGEAAAARKLERLLNRPSSHDWDLRGM